VRYGAASAFPFVTWPNQFEQSFFGIAIMAIVAIGGIHGNLSAAEDLLANVMPAMGQGYILVFLGDYIDRGPDTRECWSGLCA
jgi:hypothetical protein